MLLKLSAEEKKALAQIYEAQTAASGPAVDLSRRSLAVDPAAPAADDKQLAQAMIARLGWPQWVRFFKKPSLAVITASRLARSRSGNGGVLWMAPGTGRHFDPPKGSPGMAMLRGDWAPDADSMAQAQAEAREKGLVLVVDESVTGFRLAPGGACEFFGLEPDLALFGPPLAGGEQWGALAGNGQAPKISGAEPDPQAMAAAAWCLERMSAPGFCEHLAGLGRLLCLGLDYLSGRAGLEDELAWEGPFSLPRLSGRRIWAFMELAREEGLGLGPVVMLDPELSLEDFQKQVWTRLARATARLAELPEGEKAPESWEEAANVYIHGAGRNLVDQ